MVTNKKAAFDQPSESKSSDWLFSLSGFQAYISGESLILFSTNLQQVGKNYYFFS